MNKKIVAILIAISFFSCSSQKKVLDLMDYHEMQYIVSNITQCPVLSKEMFDASFYINIFQFSDSRMSIEYEQETEEIMSSFLITALPDGDYYTESKMFKISGFLNPNLVDIEEKEYPRFNIVIEHGDFNKRQRETFSIYVKF